MCFIALFIKHTMLMCHIVTCVLSGSKIFLHIISQRALFKKNNIKCVFFFLYNLRLKHSHFRRNSARCDH